MPDGFEDYMSDGTGELLEGTPPASPNPQLKSQWDSALADPKNKAFLMQAGLQMMMPNWGGSLATSVAQGIGAGSEAASGVERTQKAEAAARASAGATGARQDKEIAARKSESALDRTSREKIAAGRSSGSAGLGTLSKGRQALYNRMYEKAKESLYDVYSEDPQALSQAAHSQAMTDFRASEEAAGISGGPKPTSGNPAAGVAGGDSALGNYGETGQSNTANTVATIPSASGNLKPPPPKDHAAYPNYERLMKTDQGRKLLREKYGIQTESQLQFSIPGIGSYFNLRGAPPAVGK